MEAFNSEGSFSDRRGTDHVLWRVRPYGGPSRRYPSFEIMAVVRGVEISGFDFEMLGPVDANAADGHFDLDRFGDLSAYEATGSLPLTIRQPGGPIVHPVEFALRVPGAPDVGDAPRRSPGESPTWRLRMTLGARTYSVSSEWFEDCWTELMREIGSDVDVECCWSCLFSDYSPGGHSGMGMSCHRSAKEQYLAVRSKHDYWSIPVTEEVPENYRCVEWTRRIPGTGYRG